MRLPQHLLNSPYFVFETDGELIGALGETITAEELAEIRRLSAMKLPPATSRHALAAMLGVNPGLIWSLENRTRLHYRHFTIPKGRGVRDIYAPRIALKIVQKWLSWHLQKSFVPPDHVYGFVPGKSHIGAAAIYCNSKWVFSTDISDFFPSTPYFKVCDALKGIGYNDQSSQLLTKLCCLRDVLSQGSPASPVLSNIVFAPIDVSLVELAERYGLRLTRYADDIVFSGTGEFPEELAKELSAIFVGTPWRLSPEKTQLSVVPKRLKVHGLLVHGQDVRLTKGYRNKIRAYKHLLSKGSIKQDDLKRVIGHLQYERQICRKSAS